MDFIARLPEQGPGNSRLEIGRRGFVTVTLILFAAAGQCSRRSERSGEPNARRVRCHAPHCGRRSLFFLFSNRLGCLGSILISVVATLILLAVMGWL
jgi:hypothetical protein